MIALKRTHGLLNASRSLDKWQIVVHNSARDKPINCKKKQKPREEKYNMVDKERVCVTGAGGYQASWLVKLLLSKGFVVHGTVRDPSDEKNAHLKKLEKASENLRLFKAELLDYDALYAAIEGCSGVFHLATPVILRPVSNPDVEIIEPAVKGTSNVLKACVAAKIKKVVVVSSIAAVMFNPSWPTDQAMDESCWSIKDFCKKNEDWYAFSKTEAETQAWEYAKTSGLNMVTLCAGFIIGPMLHPQINESTMLVVRLMKDGLETEEDRLVRMYVDVRDVAEALLLVYEKPEAEGRYICSAYTVPMQDLVDKLKTMYPHYKYPKRIPRIMEKYPELSSEKLKELGWKYRPFEETLVDFVQDFQEKGILAKV